MTDLKNFNIFIKKYLLNILARFFAVVYNYTNIFIEMEKFLWIATKDQKICKELQKIFIPPSPPRRSRGARFLQRNRGRGNHDCDR